MKKILRASLFAILILSISVASVFAGSVHLTGKTSVAVGSLTVNGQIAGLGGTGLNVIYARFTAYGVCNYPAGPNFTQVTTTSVPVANGNATFSMTVYAPCAGEVWTSAVVEIASDPGFTNIFASQTYLCSCKFSNKTGRWETTCREAR